ncbi:RNA polymerase sigma factor [uncultured Nitrospira sp.]|uniref:RNA polymerase sigma factor n=1 Tax=uncultured Nitrospira sp. TaxID=157176 RepID=UPI003140A2A3
MDMMQLQVAQMFDQHRQEVKRFLISRVSCEATAADLTQETFLRLSQLSDLQSIRNIRSYLFRIAANLATDHLRTQIRWKMASSEEEPLLLEKPDTSSTPESVLVAKEELRIVLQAIQELSPLCREIFLLNRYEGFAHREIANRLNVCMSTVEKNIARALNQCRRRLNEAAESSEKL